MSAVPSERFPEPVREVKATTCYMCACRCGIRVHVVDGEVRYIEGNPAHPLNKGVICAKGSSGIMKQYSPARLTRPLLRKAGAERGSGTPANSRSRSDFSHSPSLAGVSTIASPAKKISALCPGDNPATPRMRR